MTTAPSPPSSPPSAGFTLIEAITGLVIGGAAITMAIWIGATFLSKRETTVAVNSNLRLQIDELGFALQQDQTDAPQAYLFAGRLRNADGTDYSGTHLTFNRPLYQITSAGDFLTATGLTLAAPGSGTDLTAIVAVATPAQPILITRDVSTDTNGWTHLRLQYSGRYGTRAVALSIPPSTTGTQLDAVCGSAALDPTDSHVVLTLPNPLAISTNMLPQVNAGMAIHFNRQLAQTRP